MTRHRRLHQAAERRMMSRYMYASALLGITSAKERHRYMSRGEGSNSSKTFVLDGSLSAPYGAPESRLHPAQKSRDYGLYAHWARGSEGWIPENGGKLLRRVHL